MALLGAFFLLLTGSIALVQGWGLVCWVFSFFFLGFVWFFLAGEGGGVFISLAQVQGVKNPIACSEFSRR